jgi:hypothetical protein
MSSREKHLRNMRPLGNEEPAGQKREGDGEARPRQLPAWDCLDLLASAFGMWTAFASRTVNRCCTDRLADLGIGKVKP